MIQILISPSGKLYGSENVLFDFLNQTTLKFDSIYVPKNSPFKKKLELNGHKTEGFTNVIRLYIDLFLKILTEKIVSVYCNEAGHIKYIRVLAKLFPKVNFIIHVRILEDTPRLSEALPNLRYVSISKTIQVAMLAPSTLIYDGYSFMENKRWRMWQVGVLKIGIVGRVTASKGLYLLNESFFANCGPGVEFHFYGDIDIENEKKINFDVFAAQKNTHFHGFVTNKNFIYPNIDILLHLNENEPLGRIFFESIDFGVPFIGINSGGISEIGELINYPYLFPKDNLPIVLNELSLGKWSFDIKILENSRKIASQVFSNKKYAESLELILKR